MNLRRQLLLSKLSGSTRAVNIAKIMRGQDILPPHVTTKTLNLCDLM